MVKGRPGERPRAWLAQHPLFLSWLGGATPFASVLPENKAFECAAGLIEGSGLTRG